MPRSRPYPLRCFGDANTALAWPPQRQRSGCSRRRSSVQLALRSTICLSRSSPLCPRRIA